MRNSGSLELTQLDTARDLRYESALCGTQGSSGAMKIISARSAARVHSRAMHLSSPPARLSTRQRWATGRMKRATPPLMRRRMTLTRRPSSCRNSREPPPPNSPTLIPSTQTAASSQRARWSAAPVSSRSSASPCTRQPTRCYGRVVATVAPPSSRRCCVASDAFASMNLTSPLRWRPPLPRPPLLPLRPPRCRRCPTRRLPRPAIKRARRCRARPLLPTLYTRPRNSRALRPALSTPALDVQSLQLAPVTRTARCRSPMHGACDRRTANCCRTALIDDLDVRFCSRYAGKR